MRFGIREVIFILVLLAVPVASFWYLFKPRNQQISQASEEIKIKQAQLEKLNTVLSRIPDLGKAIDEGRTAINDIEKKLPYADDVEGILERVWQISRENRLLVKSVKSEKPVPYARYMELPLKTVIEGEFDGFYQFMLELEALPRITRINQLKLQKIIVKPGATDDPQPAAGDMRAEFTLSIYFESREQDPSAAPNSR
jgi:type IV pilus assembly protein PilO